MFVIIKYNNGCCQKSMLLYSYITEVLLVLYKIYDDIHHRL